MGRKLLNVSWYNYTDILMEGTKEGNVLLNDTLNTFNLRLYGVGHMVKNQDYFIYRKVHTMAFG